MPQKAAIGSAGLGPSTTTANARSNVSPSACQRAMRISSPEPVRGRGLGHLPQAEVDALGEQHVEQTDAVASGPLDAEDAVFDAPASAPSLPVTPHPVRQVGLVLAQPAPPARLTTVGPATRRLRQSGSSSAAPSPAVAVNDPVDGLALHLEHGYRGGGLRPACGCGRGACRTCRDRLGRACRATLAGGSTPARGAGAGPPSRAPGRPRAEFKRCGTGSADSCR